MRFHNSAARRGAAAALAWLLVATVHGCRRQPPAVQPPPSPPNQRTGVRPAPVEAPAANAPGAALAAPQQPLPAGPLPPDPFQPVTVHPAEGIAVIVNDRDPTESRVEIQSWTCLDAGWLEQVACTPGTREHESLLFVKARPSEIHYAMLLAGFQPGAPGRWVYENDSFSAIGPTGDEVDVSVRYSDPQQPGGTIEHHISRWIRGPKGETFPLQPWVFGGSIMAPNPESMGPGEHYVADFSGSVVGLVTFGDEVIGFSRVLADQADVQEPLWEANTDTLPPLQTEVTLILKKVKPL